MKIPLSLALLAPLILPCIAHAQNSDARSDALPMAPKSAATADAFVWRFAPPIGSRWTMRTFFRSVTTTPLPLYASQSALIHQMININRSVADYDVMSRDKWGATTIRLTYREYVNSTTQGPVGVGVEPPQPTSNANAKAIDGANFTFKQGPDGRIWSAVGVRAFERRRLQAQGEDEETIQEILDGKNARSGKEIAQGLIESAFEHPKYPVRVGESWNNSIELSESDPRIEIRGTRTLKSLNSQLAWLSQSLSFNGSQLAPNIGAPNETYDIYRNLVVAITGNTRIERSSGMTLEENMTSKTTSRRTTEVKKDGSTLNLPVNTVITNRFVLQPR